MRPSARWHLNVLLLALAAGCGQVDPFTNPDFTEPGPFDPTPPVRLTYNPGLDVEPAFLLGGEVVFGFARPGERNENQCLGALPNQGGTTVAESCPRTVGSRDSTERFGEARPISADSVVLVFSSRWRGRRVDDFAWIGTAPWRSATEFTPRLRFPFVAASGRLQIAPTHLSRIGPTLIAYLATVPSSACPGFSYPCMSQVLVTYGLEVGQVDLANTAPASVLSNTAITTSIAPGRTPGSILLTRPADLRIYERGPDGAVAVLATVPGFVAVRDPTLAGSRLVSVVDGALDFYTLPDSTTLVQVAGGGNLVMTNLETGTTTTVATGEWSRPMLSPDGRQLVAVSGDDIYRFDLP